MVPYVHHRVNQYTTHNLRSLTDTRVWCQSVSIASVLIRPSGESVPVSIHDSMMTRGLRSPTQPDCPQRTSRDRAGTDRLELVSALLKQCCAPGHGKRRRIFTRLIPPYLVKAPYFARAARGCWCRTTIPAAQAEIEELPTFRKLEQVYC